MYHNFISVLSFEDLGLYRKHHNQTRLEERTDLGVTLGLLSIECIILFICLFQLLRFILNCPGRLYLKKVVHALIALEMLVCMLQAVNIPSFYEEFLHEATFIFCSLIYFNVLLFWYDFYCKLSKGEGITFFTETPLSCLYCFVYNTTYRRFYYHAIRSFPATAMEASTLCCMVPLGFLHVYNARDILRCCAHLWIHLWAVFQRTQKVLQKNR